MSLTRRDIGPFFNFAGDADKNITDAMASDRDTDMNSLATPPARARPDPQAQPPRKKTKHTDTYSAIQTVTITAGLAKDTSINTLRNYFYKYFFENNTVMYEVERNYSIDVAAVAITSTRVVRFPSKSKVSSTNQGDAVSSGTDFPGA
ncbi:hypothetical protein GN244_ATG20141 [Phytophthora infestans]|uniref:Uncharacterized protein n=1 Tax=Phytophthora infestans TaxID=4787 RepID=A0A833WCE3_PHYIN|nr:hypothetical protein GN244_ATG20141 [Phytophthora infestans]